MASLAEWKFLLYYLLSEQFPSITITCFFNTASVEDGDSLNEVEGLYSNNSKDSKDKNRKKQRKNKSRPEATNSRSGSDYQNLAGGANEVVHEIIYDEGNSSEDSEFGSFNPNLNAPIKSNDEALERLGPNLFINH